MISQGLVNISILASGVPAKVPPLRASHSRIRGDEKRVKKTFNDRLLDYELKQQRYYSLSSLERKSLHSLLQLNVKFKTLTRKDATFDEKKRIVYIKGITFDEENRKFNFKMKANVTAPDFASDKKKEETKKATIYNQLDRYVKGVNKVKE